MLSKCKQVVPSHVSLVVTMWLYDDQGCSLSACLVQLVSNSKINPLSFQHDCNHGNHSVVKATNSFYQCI